jgi:large subunit ribosomal protein L32e
MNSGKAESRNKLKARKPKFVRQESWRYDRVDESWRRPRGTTSRMRRRRRGWPKSVSVGYKMPEKLRHLHPSGFREVNVSRVEDLERLDASQCVVRISHTVGERKRVAILDRARELQIRVLNPGGEVRTEAPELKEPAVETHEAAQEEVQPTVAQEKQDEEPKQ